MIYRKLYIGAAACVGVALLLLTCLYFVRQGPQWPDFPANAPGPAPVVITQVDRDFGYRTGDAIPVSIFIKQFPGTEVDVNGLALDGDFEIRGGIKTETRRTEDGGSITRLDMVVQSFAFKPVISGRISMTWSQNGSKDWKEIDPVRIELHTSPTYDGRDQLQEGKLKFVQGPHLLITIGWLLAGIAIAVLATLYIRRELANLPEVVDPPRKLTLWEWAVVRFDAAWARIEAGDRSDEVFADIDYIVRTLLHVQAVQISHLDMALSMHPYRKEALYIVRCCETVTFTGAKLSEKHVAGIKVAFDRIVSRKVVRTGTGSVHERGAQGEAQDDGQPEQDEGS